MPLLARGPLSSALGEVGGVKGESHCGESPVAPEEPFPPLENASSTLPWLTQEEEEQ